MNCPSCKVEMTEGFLLDLGHLNSPQVAGWVEGPPEISWWSGLKTKGKELRRVQANCCPQCGLVQLYAKQVES